MTTKSKQTNKQTNKTTITLDIRKNPLKDNIVFVWDYSDKAQSSY